MARKRLFLDISCLEAARQRIRHVYDTFDTVCVQYSGGKDSSAILYLAKEVHEERDLGPVKTIFRDEEMVSPATVRHLEEVRKYDWIDMEWYCLPRGSEVWVLGRREWVLLWDPEREAEGRLVREFPPWAYRSQHFGLDPSKPVPHGIDYYTMQGKEGRVAFLTGVRANESMMRYRSLTQKLNENYITRPYKMSKAVPLRFAKPIYDWTTDDVFKFLEEKGATYSEYYDFAALSGANTRVGIPLHAVAARRLSDVAITEPEFYDSLVNAFPYIEAQRRLWADYDIELVISEYVADGWDGVRRCIDDHVLTPVKHRHAMKFVAEFRKKQAQDPWGYPLDNLLRQILLREFQHTSPSPVGSKTRADRMRQHQLAEADALDIIDDTA